nr:putative late blight resistance protein homolog R1A-10 isoform X1 [Ipomoea batatas]
MAYAAVTSLMETLSLNFLQSQPPFPLEDLAAQIRDDSNENLGFLQQIVEVELDEASSKQSEKQQQTQMAYAAVTSLMGTIDLHFLQSQPRLPLEDLEALIKDANENLGLLQDILKESEIGNGELAEGSSQNEIISDVWSTNNAWDSVLLTSRLKEVADVKQKMVSLHEKATDVFNEAEKQQTVSLIGRIRRRGLLLAKGWYEDKRFHKSHSLHSTHPYYYWYGDVEHLKLLRVVDMSGRFSEGDKALNVLGNLVHLRYLALSTYKTFEIKLFEHRNMQSFIVSGDGVTLDSSEAYKIWKMPHLRNFCIGVIISLQTQYAVYRNLENISWLDSKLCTKDLFTMIPNLKELGIDCGYYENNLDCFYNLEHLKQLEKLSIRRWMCDKLIQGSIPWATNFLPNLKKLYILESNMPWSGLNLISMLPNLEVLKLIDACQGLKWEPSDGGFRKLKRLVIKITSLQYWNAVGDHFPMLECLEISDSYLLEEIPHGFADINTLALIQLKKCRDSLLASAKRIQDEQHKFGNDALLVRSKNIRKKLVIGSLMDAAIALQDQS